jgi:hypothetical protein
LESALCVAYIIVVGVIRAFLVRHYEAIHSAR